MTTTPLGIPDGTRNVVAGGYVEPHHSWRPTCRRCPDKGWYAPDWRNTVGGFPPMDDQGRLILISTGGKSLQQKPACALAPLPVYF